MKNMYPPNCEKCFGCIHFGSMRRPFINNGNETWEIGCKECTGYEKEKSFKGKIKKFIFKIIK